MTLVLKALTSLILLVFVFNTAKGSSWVESLDVSGVYKAGNCNADVTCYVSSTEFMTFIYWTCIGGPYGITDINNIPGFRVGRIENNGVERYKQTITITECYSKLKLTCRVGSSERSVTLTADNTNGNDDNAISVIGLSIPAIVGIVFAVVFVLSAIAGCVGLARRKRSQGVVVGGGFVNPVTNVNPLPPGAYPTQPQPFPYPGTTFQSVPQQSPPPPYPGIK